MTTLTAVVRRMSREAAPGFQALSSNTEGWWNTASGEGALQNNTVGGDNTATGFEALHSNTGNNNTATGALALRLNISGSDNTATGTAAMGSNITGEANTASGVDALIKSTSGSNNAAFGYGALSRNTTGDKNTALGFAASKQFRHYRPMAQDFFAAFGHDGIGTIGTDTTITSTDMDGILMVAAQALEKRSVEQRREIEALRAENADLRVRLEAVERIIGSKAD